MSRRFAFALMLLALGSGLSACNTLNGLGQDMQGAGRAVENTF
jgi:predicted small secreted protein